MSKTFKNNNNKTYDAYPQTGTMSPNVARKQPSQLTTAASSGKKQSTSSAGINRLYQVINPNVKYQQSDSKKLSRYIDNLTSELQPDPWLPPELYYDCKYTYDDSGLGIELNDEYQVNLNKTHDHIRELRGKNDQRTFLEFTQSKLSNLCVLIEYCSECQSHEITTKHDEKVYINKANSLRTAILKQFPIVKITLKPVRTDPNSSDLKKQATLQRIGAFEVFVKKGDRETEQRIVKCLFSKMEVGKWPKEEDILTQLRDYMESFQLVVTLSLNGFDQSRIQEEDFDNKIENKLYDIPIQLVPDSKIDEKNNKPSTGTAKKPEITNKTGLLRSPLQQRKQQTKKEEEVSILF